jgi:hypothetical protein
MSYAEASGAITGAASSADKLRTFSREILSQHLRFAEEPMRLSTVCPNSSMLVVRLQAANLLAEAARLLGYALPAREAVWWACMCVAHTAPADLAPEQQAALAAAELWVWQSTHETRVKAARAALAAGPDTPAGWTARAAFASHPAVPPYLRCGRRVERAVAGAAVSGDATRRMDRLRRFIASGRDIARGGAGRLPPGSG